MFKKMSNKIKSIATTASLGVVTAVTSIVPSFADKAKETTEAAKNVTSSDDVMTKVIFLAFTVFKYIGFGLLVWGTGQLILAYRNDDSDSKVRAVSCLAVGAGLFGLQAIFETLGISLN